MSGARVARVKTSGKGLEQNAVGFLGALGIRLASTAPARSLYGAPGSATSFVVYER